MHNDVISGIPLHLLPSVKSREAQFVVHWMNNKDFSFTYAAEMFSREICDKMMSTNNATEHTNHSNGAPPPQPPSFSYSRPVSPPTNESNGDGDGDGDGFRIDGRHKQDKQGCHKM